MDDVDLGRAERRALGLSSLAIALVVVLQAPGRIVPETKLDVVLDPVGFLGRALSAWDPSGGFGRVQNQAIGYLFPMGAFSALGRLLGIPPWLVQRLWIALVLLVALWGAHRVARAIGIGSPSGRVIAALAYALAPATLSIGAFQSAGQLPYALAPFVLVPLLTARDGDDPRRVAGRSALWIAAMGGVNGASAFAVLPLVLVWFATRTPGRFRRRLFAWWTGGAVAATLWWLIPLLVSVRYGIRFTDYTETASLTTWTESGTEILRGTGNWLSFLQTDGGWWLPGGRALTADRVAVLGSVAVAAGGIYGLSRRDAPGRSWLVPSLVLGFTVMGIGYAGAWSGFFSEPAQQLLDGLLVPFRNVHKFSALLRLPLALGLGHLVVVLARRTTRPAAQAETDQAVVVERRWTHIGTALAVVAVCLAVLPAARGRLTAPGSFTAVPESWERASDWLDEHDDGSRTLLIPGSAFGEYLWGRPLDEPISSISDADWAVRDLIPLGGNGSTRLLDGVDAGLQRSSLPPGFVATLQRAGVGHLVVRNDLDLIRTGGPRPATVRRLLDTAPGLELVASFGAVQPDPGRDRRLASPAGQPSTEAFRSIDIYTVPDPVDRVAAYPATDALLVSGGPEAMLDLEPTLTDGRAVILAVDDGATDLEDPILVATDTARRRDVTFGSIRDNASYVLTPTEDGPLTHEAPVDRWPAGSATRLTDARLEGAASLTDSRGPGQGLRPSQQPYAAFDGDPSTAWGPSDQQVGEWVEVTLDEPQELERATVTVPDVSGQHIAAVRVTTDQGSVVGEIGEDGSTTVDLPPGTTDSLRVTIDAIEGTRPLARLGISEIAVEGLEVTRPLVVPSPADAGAEVVSLTRDRLDPFHVLRDDEEVRLDREFRWAGSGQATIRGTATAAPGTELEALLAAATDASSDAIEATATSTFGDLPAFAPSAAADGDPLTAWVSGFQADAPAITLSWDGPVPVDTLTVDVLDGAADPVSMVTITIDGTATVRPLSASGQVSFPSTITDSIIVSFPADEDDALARQVAVAEITVPALLGRTSATADRDQPITLPCGDGPTLEVDGEVVPTRGATTVGAMLDALPIEWEACSPTALEPGDHRLATSATVVNADTVIVEPTTAIAPPPAPRSVSATSWGTDDRSVAIGAGDAAIIATTENFNTGWEATIDGEALDPIQVDGWRQGWRVPAGAAGTIDLTYRPATTQRAGLIVGLLALGGLILATLLPSRRRSEGSGWEPPGARPWSTLVAIVLMVLAGAAVGGPVVLLAVGLVLLPERARRLPWISAGALVGAGLVTFVWAGAKVGDTTGTFSGPAQALATVAVMAAAASLLPDRNRSSADQALDEAAG